MEDPERTVLDISSDEEVGWGVKCTGGGGAGVRDDGDWISEVFGEMDRKTEDSDEVVVVGEVFACKKRKIAYTPSVNCGDNDDDECVVLDGDPDKLVAVDNDGGGGENSDDLCVISEKGQVACRDYPHPRHLCAKFSFNSSPHERHCDQCHCYVCDSLAPCVNWGSGISSIDHCHATDKDEYWKAQRKSSKKSNQVPPVIPGVPDTSLPIGPTPMIQTPSFPTDPLQENQLRQAAHQLCSMATNTGAPNARMHSRTQHPRYDPGKKFQPHLVSQQLQSGFSNAVPQNRMHNVCNAGAQFISQHAPFKRTSIVGGVLTTNRHGCISPKSSYGHQFPRNQLPVTGWQDPRHKVTPFMGMYQGSHQANMSAIAAIPLSNYAPSHPPVSIQTLVNSVNASNLMVTQAQVNPQMCVDSNFANSMATVPGVATANSMSTLPGVATAKSMSTLPGVATLNNWGTSFENPMPILPQAISSGVIFSSLESPVPAQPVVTFQPNMNSVFENPTPVPAQPVVTFQPNMSSVFENPTPVTTQPVVSFQSNMSSVFENPTPVPAQPVVTFQPSMSSVFENPTYNQVQVQGQPASVSNNGQKGSEKSHQTEAALHSSSADTPMSMSDTNQSLPIESTQLLSTMLSDNLTPSVSSHIPVSTNLALSPESASSFEFDKWSLQDEPGLEGLDIPASPGLNAFSPESARIDGSFFFGF